MFDALWRAKRAFGRERDEVAREGACKTPPKVEHVLLARQVGVEHVVCFVNKVDIADPELVDLVEIEAAELLEAHGYLDPVFVRGSALHALRPCEAGRFDDPATDCVRALVAALDEHVPVPARDLDGPFLMPIEGVCTIPGLGTVEALTRSRSGLPREG